MTFFIPSRSISPLKIPLINPINGVPFLRRLQYSRTIIAIGQNQGTMIG